MAEDALKQGVFSLFLKFNNHFQQRKTSRHSIIAASDHHHISWVVMLVFL
jgi:hypothetical protein